jgi:hypothetical protein
MTAEKPSKFKYLAAQMVRAYPPNVPTETAPTPFLSLSRAAPTPKNVPNQW